MMLHEQVVAFGLRGQIQGIVTAPGIPAPGARRAVVMSNVGMHHRVGPFRLYVELARAMAADGWLALRFDYLGMGESGPRNPDDDRVSDESQDLADAIDFLHTAHGIDEVVLVALCSGVDGAHPIALRHARVRGVVFIDGYTYPTAGFLVRRYIHRGLQLNRWKRFLSRRLRTLLSPAYGRPASDAVFVRTLPTREEFRRDIASLLAQGVRAHFIFTGTVDSSFNSEGQMFEILGPGIPAERIAVTRVKDADHVFTVVSARQDVIRRIRDWARHGTSPVPRG
jgi:pimeloyl-ACP methyl ester carboxylesterase